MKTAVVLTVAVLANSLGTVCLSKGMKQFEDVESLRGGELVRAAFQGITNPWVLVGVVLLAGFLACYMAALSWADLSFVLPATAPGYILTVFFSSIFLNETISPARWAGTLLIVAGTWLVARTYSSRTESEQIGMAQRAPQGFGKISADPRTRVAGENRID